MLGSRIALRPTGTTWSVLLSVLAAIVLSLGVLAPVSADEGKLTPAVRALLEAWDTGAARATAQDPSAIYRYSPLRGLAESGKVEVEIRATGRNPFIVNELRKIDGLEIVGPASPDAVIPALASPAAIRTLDSLPIVESVGLAPVMIADGVNLQEMIRLGLLEPPQRPDPVATRGILIPGYRGAGQIKSDAADSLDLGLTVPEDISTTGAVTGKGVRVGVISDGINFSPNPASTDDDNGLGDWPKIDSTLVDAPLIPAGGFFRGNSRVLFRSFFTNALIISAATTAGIDIMSPEAQTAAATQGFEGSGMIEIVHDIAPLADKYFSNLGTPKEFHRAKNWLANEALCDIIVDDLSFIAFTVPQLGDLSPPNGTTEIPLTNDEIVRNGTLYVKSAGNSALSSYFNTFTDSNGNGFHDFRPLDPNNPGVTLDESLEIDAVAGAVVMMTWLEPNGKAGDDIDLRLFDPQAGPQAPIAESDFVQDGNDDPAEVIIVPASGRFSIAVLRKNRSSLPARPFLLDFLGALPVDHRTRVTSYRDGASQREGLSIGAVRANAAELTPIGSPNENTLEEFSARGRTMDGRLKPEMVAQDGVETLTFPQGSPVGQRFFFGTSASAPHVAGVAALALHQQRLLGNDPTPEQLFDIVRIACEQVPGRNRRNLNFGAGRLNAGRLTDGGATLNLETGEIDFFNRLPGVGLTYFENRSVVFDLSRPEIRAKFVTSEGDAFLEALFTTPIFRGVDDFPELDGVQVQGVDANTFGHLVSPKVDFDMSLDGRDISPERDTTYLKMGRVYTVRMTVASDTQVGFSPFRMRTEAAEFQNITEYVVTPSSASPDVIPTAEGTVYTWDFIPRDRPALAGMRIAFDYFGVAFDQQNPNFNTQTLFTVKRIEIEEKIPVNP